MRPADACSGLFSFIYVSLHFLNWLVLDRWLDGGAILADIAKRPYITVGFAAFLMLVPLAVTSTNGWMRRLGGAGSGSTAWYTWPRSSAACTTGGR